MNSGARCPGRADLWICLALILTTLALYSPVRNFDFVNYDDTGDVSENPHVQLGMSGEGIRWALFSTGGSNWLPMVRLSYLLQYRAVGFEAGWYHVANLVFHLLAALALFFFLLRATNARWPSAFVAFVFALHPLHVESVAWVAERKDVLCAFFWFPALWAWVRYTEQPSWTRYLPALLLFCLGLMSKPMIVTLPFVLLLLDQWPLQRKFSLRLLVEKLPFFALSAGSAIVTWLAQHKGGAVQATGQFPPGLRVQNALITWVVYIVKMFWPAQLFVPYPYPRQIALWRTAAALLALTCVTALVLRCFRTRPYLAVGWFWYLGTLVPVIGLIQVGVQARADRYMYVPMVGLSIMLAWGGRDVLRQWPKAAPWVWALGAGALMALLPVTWLQIHYWKNTDTLFGHGIDATGGNPLAYEGLGMALATMPGRSGDAIAAFEAGLRADPRSDRLHSDLGGVLMDGNLPLAVDHLRTALRIDPANAAAHSNLSVALLRMGRPAEAIEEARTALRITPGYPAAQTNLGAALLYMGRIAEAMEEARAVLRIRPDSVSGHQTLGSALFRLGRWDEAASQFREVLRIAPDNREAHNSLGLTLAKDPGQTFESLFEFEEALRISPGYVEARVNLARALAPIPGRLPEAIAHLRLALKIHPDPGLQRTLERLEAAQERREQ